MTPGVDPSADLGPLGPGEIERNAVTVRDMESGEQQEVPRDRFLALVRAPRGPAGG